MQESNIFSSGYNEELIKYGVNYALGVELKRIRLKQNLTLKGASDGICCQSYLCKIENNMIKPSGVYFKLLCSRLNIDEETAKYLYNLNGHLYDCVKAYVTCEYETVKDIYLKIEKMDNHYADLIRIIYYFSLEDYFTCRSLLRTISKYIIKNDYFAYKTFLVCKMIVSFETKDLKTCENYLSLSSGVMIEKYLDTLVLEYKFYLNAETGDSFTIDIYEEIRRRVDKEFSFPRFDKVLTYLIVYYLTVKKFSFALNATKGIENINTKNDMLYLIYMHTNELEKAHSIKRDVKNPAFIISSIYNFGGDLENALDSYVYKKYPNPFDTYVKYIKRTFECSTMKDLINPITVGIEESADIDNKYLFNKFSRMFIDFFKDNKGARYNKKYHEISALIIDSTI